MTRLEELTKQLKTLEEYLDDAKECLDASWEYEQEQLCYRDIEEAEEELESWWKYNGKEYQELLYKNN